MKLLDIFKKNVKSVEETEKNLQATREELAKVQQEIAEKNTQKGQLAQAIPVVSASLVIDPKDAEAKKKKEQAEKKIQEITKEVEALSQKQTELQAQVSEAQKAVGQSKGEVFKQEHVRSQTASKVVEKLKSELGGVKLPASPKNGWINWAEAYGYPVKEERIYSPLYGTYMNSTRKEVVNSDKVVPVLREHKAEVTSVSEKKADEIAFKVMEYAKKLLKEEGIELD
ncbi:hypothetical protein [Bacillus licheniformis]|uniref:hypothetical protein n=1 Tax=Bacillus licheniformis TaxID=1402 RepID=UPI002E24403B|nr:hypothetical protein [Bacillus licheniformis]